MEQLVCARSTSADEPIAESKRMAMPRLDRNIYHASVQRMGQVKFNTSRHTTIFHILAAQMAAAIFHTSTAQMY